MPAGREEEEEGKRKVSESSSGVGKQIAEEVRRRRRICETEHYKRERLHCAELITPTPGFANQKEEELNSWRGGEGGKKEEAEKEIVCGIYHSASSFYVITETLKIYLKFKC